MAFCFQFGGVNVDVQMTEGAVYVTFSPYSPGMAPALILNHTNDALSLWEKDANITMYVSISFFIECHLSVFLTYIGPCGTHGGGERCSQGVGWKA
jgi:hypothetical protein